MKWKTFRELTPLDRRQQRKSRSQGFKARARYLSHAAKRLPHGQDLNKYPEMLQAVLIMAGYAAAHTPEEIKAWLNWRIGIIGTDPQMQRLAPFHLLILGKEFPEDIFGFFDADGQFVPGIVSLLARKMGVSDLYTDTLDDVLSEDDLSGMTIDEVVARCKERGFTTRSETVRQRILTWDKST